MTNAFEELCLLASKENWCWNLYCTTCGHLHFRYAFAELAKEKIPFEKDWIIHSEVSNYNQQIGNLPRNFTNSDKETIIKICCDADLTRISKNCRFPDWLGYLGLVLHHLTGLDELDRKLSLSWASQLKQLVSESSQSSKRLETVCLEDSRLLNLSDLEFCERDIHI